MEGTESRTKQSLPSQLQQVKLTQSLDAQPIAQHDNVAYDAPAKEQPKAVGNDISYELEKREPIDSDLSDDLDIQEPAGIDIGNDVEKQKPQSYEGKGEAVGEQNEEPCEDPNLVCLPLRARRGKDID